jgi:hypothetical protein
VIRLVLLLACAAAVIVWLIGAFPRRLIRRTGFKAVTVVLVVIWLAAIAAVITRL